MDAKFVLMVCIRRGQQCKIRGRGNVFLCVNERSPKFDNDGTSKNSSSYIYEIYIPLIRRVRLII